MKRKLFTLLMLMQIAILSLHSATTFKFEDLNYEIISEDEKTVSVASWNSATEDVNVPETAKCDGEDYTVISIGAFAFRNNTGLKSISIPNSVISIKDYAFSGCSGLKSVDIGNSVTSIGRGAFYNCTNLASIIIPNSVTSIMNESFLGCTKLIELRFEDGDETLTLENNSTSSGGTGKGLFSDCPLETLYLGRDLSYNSSSSFGYSPFYNITKLKYVTIGNSVNTIGEYAFSGCSGLTNVVIGNSVTTINKRAFSRCSELTNVTIVNSVTSIGEYAFSECPGITNVVIPNSVTTIDKYAFYKCSGLINVTIPDFVTSIGEGIFEFCSGMTSVIIGKSVTSLGDYAFRGCSLLTSMMIPKSVNSIGNYAFTDCKSLKDLIFEDGDETLTLGDKGGSTGLFYDCPLKTLYLGRTLSYKNPAFYNITTLTQVTVGNSVTSIGERLFGNTNLSTITIGKAVNSIEANAFPSSLRIVSSLNPTPPTIKENTFNSQTIQSGVLLVLESVLNNYRYAAYWNEFLKIDAIPDSGRGDSDDQNGESIFNAKIDKYIYMAVDEEKTFTDYLPSDATANAWESTDDDIVEVTKKGKAEAYEYGNVVVRALDSDGEPIITLGVFVCPTVKIHYGTGKSYEHHVIYNSTPSLYIAAPEGYEIAGVSHDGEDVTEQVKTNYGYYTPASPITDNSTITVTLNSIATPGDLNGDGKVDASDLNWLLEQILN